jgi:hypothetical protein
MANLEKEGLERLWGYIVKRTNAIGKQTINEAKKYTDSEINEVKKYTDSEITELVGDSPVSDQIDAAVRAIPQVDWNQSNETAADFIKNKPFGETTTTKDAITWDGNTDGLECVMGMAYHVSSATPTLADFQKGGAISAYINGQTIEYPFTSENVIDIGVMGTGKDVIMVECEAGVILVALKAGGYFTVIEEDINVSFAKAGIYLSKFDNDYLSSLTINDYTFTETEITPIPTKYLEPFDYNEGSNSLEVDFTNITEPNFSIPEMGYFYKISDEVLTADDLIKSTVTFAG